MIVDIHAHYIPQKMLEALAGGRVSFPNVDVMHDGDTFKLAFAGGTPTRPVMGRLRDADSRRKWMAGNAIDIQVTGGWLDGFGYELPPSEGAAWSRYLSESLLEATADAPFLAPLASVPLQDGDLAAQVLREVLAAGHRGIMIGTQPHGGSGNLDDPDLDPFWEAASELGAILYIHPMFGCGDPRLLDYGLINAAGRGLDTTTAVARLLYAGHFLKYPGMKVVLSHGGGALAFMLGRLQHNAAIHPGQFADPTEGFRHLYFDTVLSDPAALKFLAGKVGTDRLMMGSDYPFPIGDMAPCNIVRDAGFSEIDTSAILGGNAAKLFRLDSGHSHG
ncbi:MAG: amidohydrolase family protein [Alphaproteobacteria bacterium]